MIDEGLPDRAITRDIEWGVEIPVDDLGPGKRIYVWFDAVIGYLSASKEWAVLSDDDEAWKRWWEDSDAESYYFVGKDNIPFHTVIWPAMLMGYGGLDLPTDVPANQYVTFASEKASAAAGLGSRSGGTPSGWSRTLCDMRSPRSSPSRTTPTSVMRTSFAASTRSWSPPGATWSTGSSRSAIEISTGRSRLLAR